METPCGLKKQNGEKAMITFRHTIPVDTYINMRKEAGWRGLAPDQAELGLSNSSYLVSAWDGDRPVGMARVVSDMGYMYVLADVIVIPEYQAQGIGRSLIENVEGWLLEQKKKYPTIMVDLMAAKGKAGFYEKFGFEIRSDENGTGPGLTRWIDGEVEPAGEPDADAKAADAEIVEIPVGDFTVKGISVEIPGTGKNVLQIKCRNGLLLCGLFSPEKIDFIDFPACVFSAPKFEDMLEGKPLFVSQKAGQMGVREDMTGREIVEIFEA